MSTRQKIELLFSQKGHAVSKICDLTLFNVPDGVIIPNKVTITLEGSHFELKHLTRQSLKSFLAKHDHSKCDQKQIAKDRDRACEFIRYFSHAASASKAKASRIDIEDEKLVMYLVGPKRKELDKEAVIKIYYKATDGRELGGKRGPSKEAQLASMSHSQRQLQPVRTYQGLHPSSLQNGAHMHEWVFGALSELLDNSIDANAKRIMIDIEERTLGHCLTVADDGDGMSPSQLERMLTYGHESTHDDGEMIGRYGVGFKQGAMRIGKDALIFTKTPKIVALGLFSQTFNAQKKELQIPIVVWKNGGKLDMDYHDTREHAIANLKAIVHCTGMKQADIVAEVKNLKQFASVHGTKIVLYNLRFKEIDRSAVYELNFTKDNRNILIHSSTSGNFLRKRVAQACDDVPVDYSLREYLRVYRFDSRHTFMLRGLKVDTDPGVSLERVKVYTETIDGQFIKVTLGQSAAEYERGNCGIMLYWRARLIESYTRVGIQLKGGDRGRGIVGWVDTKSLLVPVCNKQRFEDSPIHTKVREFLNNSMDDYWFNFLGKETVQVDASWSKSLATGAGTYEKDADWVQCDSCTKWRKMPFGTKMPTENEKWYCYKNPDKSRASCDAPEQETGTARTVKVSQGAAIINHTERQSESGASSMTTYSPHTDSPPKMIVSNSSREHNPDQWDSDFHRNSTSTEVELESAHMLARGEQLLATPPHDDFGRSPHSSSNRRTFGSIPLSDLTTNHRDVHNYGPRVFGQEPPVKVQRRM
eukprot:100180_1